MLAIVADFGTGLALGRLTNTRVDRLRRRAGQGLTGGCLYGFLPMTTLDIRVQRLAAAVIGVGDVDTFPGSSAGGNGLGVEYRFVVFGLHFGAGLML